MLLTRCVCKLAVSRELPLMADCFVCFVSPAENLVMGVIVVDGAGLGGTEGKVYLDQQAPPQLPAVLYLSLAALLPAWRVWGSKGTLERCPGRTGPDPAAFLAGLAALLRQLKPDCWQVRCTNMQVALRAMLCFRTAGAAGVAGAGGSAYEWQIQAV